MRVPVIRMLTAARTSKILGPTPNFQNVMPQIGVRMSSPLLQNDGRRFYRRHVPFVPPTLDEMPVPTGSWEKYYKKQNEKANQHLAVGIGFFLLTVSVVTYKVDFNMSPPPLSDIDDDDLCPAPPPEKKCK